VTQFEARSQQGGTPDAETLGFLKPPAPWASVERDTAWQENFSAYRKGSADGWIDDQPARSRPHRVGGCV